MQPEYGRLSPPGRGALSPVPPWQGVVGPECERLSRMGRSALSPVASEVAVGPPRSARGSRLLYYGARLPGVPLRIRPSPQRGSPSSVSPARGPASASCLLHLWLGWRVERRWFSLLGCAGAGCVMLADPVRRGPWTCLGPEVLNARGNRRVMPSQPGWLRLFFLFGRLRYS